MKWINSFKKIQTPKPHSRRIDILGMDSGDWLHDNILNTTELHT